MDADILYDQGIIRWNLNNALGENYIVDYYFFNSPVEFSLLKASPDKISNLFRALDKMFIDITIFFIHS